MTSGDVSAVAKSYIAQFQLKKRGYEEEPASTSRWGRLLYFTTKQQRTAICSFFDHKAVQSDAKAGGTLFVGPVETTRGYSRLLEYHPESAQKPKAKRPKAKIPNPKFQTPNPQFQIPNRKSPIPTPKSQIPNSD